MRVTITQPSGVTVTQLHTDRVTISRYGSRMSDNSESRVSPMGHHAIDKDAATMMRINSVMMSALPASSFLPCLLLPLLLLSFSLEAR